MGETTMDAVGYRGPAKGQRDWKAPNPAPGSAQALYLAVNSRYQILTLIYKACEHLRADMDKGMAEIDEKLEQAAGIDSEVAAQDAYRKLLILVNTHFVQNIRPAVKHMAARSKAKLKERLKSGTLDEPARVELDCQLDEIVTGAEVIENASDGILESLGAAAMRNLHKTYQSLCGTEEE